MKGKNNMDEVTKKELQELQKEMDELKKTIEEYENWIDTEGAELEEMLSALAEIEKKEHNGLLHILPEDYPAPREILQQHFPRTADQCNFSGGWGYDVEHATAALVYGSVGNSNISISNIDVYTNFNPEIWRQSSTISGPKQRCEFSMNYLWLHWLTNKSYVC